MIHDGDSGLDLPDLPDFLDRRLNGVTPVGPAPRPYVPRGPRKKAYPEGTIRVFLPNKIDKTALSCGWNTVQVVEEGKKFARVKLLRKTKCYRIDREVWDKLNKEAMT